MSDLDGATGECIKDGQRTQGDPSGLNCCSQNGTNGNWAAGFFCLSKQGLTLESTVMGFPVWFWVISFTVVMTILITKIFGR